MDLEKKVADLERQVNNLVERCKVSDKVAKEAQKDARKCKEKLAGLTNAHNERVKEFIEFNGKFQGLLTHFQATYTKVEGMRLFLTAAKNKGEITVTEEDIEKLQAELKEKAEKYADELAKQEAEGTQSEEASNDDKDQGAGQADNVQPENGPSPEDGSGSSDS